MTQIDPELQIILMFLINIAGFIVGLHRLSTLRRNLDSERNAVVARQMAEAIRRMESRLPFPAEVAESLISMLSDDEKSGQRLTVIDDPCEFVVDRNTNPFYEDGEIPNERTQ